MFKKWIFLCLAFLPGMCSNAQQTINGTTMPDYEQLKNMTPAQLEAFKKKMLKDATDKAATLSVQHNIPLKSDLLSPGEIKAPVKDLERLRLLPSQPPTRVEIVSSLQASSAQIRQGIPAPKLEEIKQKVNTLPIEEINNQAIASFYTDDPGGAMALMLEASAKAPDSLLLLNNLGAMLNISGVEHKGIPLLMHCLEKIPNSSTVLNNIGQGFMALGDMLKAAEYFNRCLLIDSLNIEANHSMGMLHYFKKEYNTAMAYFEQEMSIAIRSSTLAMAYRMGRKPDLRGIMQRRQQRSGRPQKDHFEEITMGKFSFPSLPGSADEIIKERYFYNVYAASIQAEQLSWMQHATQISTSYTTAQGNQHHGLYTELVNAMLDELQDEFTPEYLATFSQSDHDHLLSMITDNMNLLNQLKQPPTPEGTRVEAQEAYEIKFCRERLKPVADNMTYQLSSFIQPLVRKGEGRWKSYINQLVDIVQLDPSAANQALVYNAVAGYFNFLAVSMVRFPAWEIINMLPKCYKPTTNEEIDSLIQADRNWKLQCPSWLNAQAKIGTVSVKIDCDKYAIEAGESIVGGYEHEFKTGRSTLLLGPGTKAEFFGLTAKVKTQAFLTFDKDNQFADAGIRNSASVGISKTPINLGGGIQLGGNLASIEATSSVSIHGGYQQNGKANGIFKRLLPKK
jgi:tetratricopeptide (TPR) repeat protein